MKNIYIIFSCILSLLFISCDGMLDNIQGYLDEGETVYVGKLVDPYTQSGKNRIKIIGDLLYGVTQKGCTIEWKNPDGTPGLKEVPIERNEQEETFSVIIEDLDEGQYDFTFVTYDALGNKSITTTTQGYVYGEFYEQSLINRSISKIEAEKKQGFLVTWRVLNDDGAIETEVTYDTADGQKTIIVPIDQNTTLLEGCIPGSKITWRTRYMPTLDAIDTFFSGQSNQSVPDNYVIQLDKSKFSELFLPTDARMDYWGFSLSRIWNGNTNWEANSMCHSSDVEGWPQWFTFDLGILTQLDRYQYWQRLQEGYLFDRGDNPRKWELYGRADTPAADGSWDGWIKLMDCESFKPSGVLDRTLTAQDIEYAKTGEVFQFPENIPPVRYIRWKTLETFSGNPVVNFQQVTFWGEDLSE